MFYSHEVLTSRKYGVATIWLVATLGAKSTLKKVNRKQILDVNVPKACQTILTPEAPMALRLQSNLLYGVSRVYSQQCGYVLADAQSAQTHMRQLLRVVKTAELDPEAGRARPDQLMLPDDPAFLPDLALLPIDFELANLFDHSSAVGSQSSSFLSPHTPLSSQSSQGVIGAAGLVLPRSSSGAATALGDFALPSIQGPGSVRPSDAPIFQDDDLGFDPNVGFGFDDEVGIYDIQERAQSVASARHPARAQRFESDSALSAQVRREHEEGRQAVVAMGAAPGSDFRPFQDDDAELLPDAEPFPMRFSAQEESALAQESSETAEAPLRRKQRARRILQMDQTMELRNSDLSRWNTDYLQNMAEAAVHKHKHRATAIAKRNADFWVLGSGIGGVGAGIGASRMQGPLAVFSGIQLLEAISDQRLIAAGEKRERDADEEGRRVRARSDTNVEVARSSGEEHTRGVGMDIDDGFVPIDIEVGRNAPSVVEEPSSAMPWNISASIRGSSVMRGLPGRGSVSGVHTSVVGPSPMFPPPFSRRGSRMVSASPLLGRGRPSGIERLSSVEHASNDFDDDFLRAPLSASQEAEGQIFQLPIPDGPVDTQITGHTQRSGDTLDTESLNFLAFVEGKITERMEREAGTTSARQDTAVPGSVLFEELLPPGSNTSVVAAQALHHTLALATRNLLSVQQSEGFGPIRMTLMSSSA